MNNLKVLVLVREGLVPPESLDGCSPEEIAEWQCEFDVITALKSLGHDTRPLGVYGDLGPLREQIVEWQPDITFMLLEEFHGITTYDHAVVSCLELMRQPYTGCNALGLMLSRDKALAKKILTYHHIATPHFSVFANGRKVRSSRRMRFPLLVKSTMEDASHGIAQASVVRDLPALAERVRFIHDNVGGDALVEEYIEGRELYVGVIGNQRLQTFPIWEMDFADMPDDLPRIATRKIKWDPAYREKYGILTRAAAGIPDKLAEQISTLSKRVFRELNMTGYARMDLRLTPEGRVYVLEANANPNLARDEDLADSALAAGVNYEELIDRILKLGLQYDAPWKR
jgi:D-alanine-D-alanine ligase